MFYLTTAASLLSIVASAIGDTRSLCDRERCFKPGFNFDEQSCNTTELQVLRIASNNIVSMVKAAIIDLYGRDKSLYNAFFLPQDRPTVLQGLLSLEKMAKNQSAAWDVRCGDHVGLCETQSGWADLSRPNDGLLKDVNTITLCWVYFTRPPSFDSCNSSKLIIWRDQITILLHELLHTSFLISSDTFSLADYFMYPEAVHAVDLVIQNQDYAAQGILPVKSVINWIWYIRYAYTKSQQRSMCPDAFPLWHAFDHFASQDADERQELRRLLFVPNSDGDQAKPPVYENFTGSDSVLSNDSITASLPQ